MSDSFREQLIHQLKERRQTPVHEHRRSMMFMKSLREKGLFWLSTLGVIFITVLVMTGLSYLIMRRAGLLTSPPVLRLDDQRWGTQYRAQASPITTVMTNGSHVYIGTEGNGLHAFDKATTLWQTYRSSEDARLLAHDRIRWLKQDDVRSDGIWTLTQSGGLSGTSDAGGSSWETFFGAIPFRGLANDTLTSAARNGRFMAVGTKNNGLGVYDLRHRTWLGLDKNLSENSRIYAVRNGLEPGVFWAGTSEGVVRLNERRIAQHYQPDSTTSTIIDLEVNNQGVWYLGDKGRTVGHIDPSDQQHILASATSMPFDPTDMTQVAQHENTLWVGTNQDGVHTYDLTTRKWKSLSFSGPDSTSLRQVTSLAYNPLANEMLISGDTGLYIIDQKNTSEDAPPDTLHFPEYQAITSVQAQDLNTYFLTQDGKIGLRRGNRTEQEGAWWEKILTRTGADSSNLATLVDISMVRIDPDDISAACQSDEYLYFGTIHGDIVWYHKPTHAWSTLQMPLPFGVDDLIFNPYTKSVVAISGRALYRSPPSLDIFILYYRIGADEVNVVPISNGYLLYTGDHSITIFDETTNRRDAIFLSNEAPEPDFKPVSVEKIGAQIYFVTNTGGVLVYDTLRHQWHRPPDIPHKDVVDLRGTGYRAIYQTSKQALYVPGSSPILGGGDSGFSDEDIRHATADHRYVWVASDRQISRYTQLNHTWEASKEISLGDLGAPSHMMPVDGKVAYRTGSRSATGDLWLAGRRIDRNVADVVSSRSTLWYTKQQGIYSWSARSGRPSQVMSYQGIERLTNERLTSGTDTSTRLWLGTNRRLLSYDLRDRQWHRYALPGEEITQLYTDNQSLYASTRDALHILTPETNAWHRLSSTRGRVTDLAFSAAGFSILYDDQSIEQISITGRTQTNVNFRLKPNTSPIPINLSNILAASQNSSFLSFVSDGYLHRYHTLDHTWQRPVPIADRRVLKAVLNENRLIALLDDGRIFTADVADPLSSLVEWAEPDETSILALNNTEDIVWIDTPLWHWERRQGQSEIIVKSRQGTDQSLSTLTGNLLTRFPFDQVQNIAHDGKDVWMSTDMGLLRFPQSSHGHIEALEWFEHKSLNHIEYIRLEDQPYQLVGWSVQDTESTWLFNQDSQTWQQVSNTQLGLNPQNESLLIDTPLWQWRRLGDSIRPTFVDPNLRNTDVFADGADQWQFRFDQVRDISLMGPDLVGIADGLLCAYTIRDSALAVSAMRIISGPEIPEKSQVRIERGADGHFISIQPSDGDRRLYLLRRENTAIHLEPYQGDTNPFSVNILFETDLWRWEREASSGRITKYVKNKGRLSEINMSNGRFAFDDMRNFAISGDHIWLATLNGIASYPFSRSSIPLAELTYETSIAGINQPDILRINIKNNTLYCEIAGEGLFSRRLTDQQWQPASPEEEPWIRHPLDSPFWTWNHDVSQHSVTGIYRDVDGKEHPITWPDGLFSFDQTTDFNWYQDALWLTTKAGIVSYPKYQGFLDIDSLRVYSNDLQSDGLITVPDDRPAQSGIYTRNQNQISRFNRSINTWEPVQPDPTLDTGYSAWTYLQDRYDFHILVDYDGFWRGRRRADNDDPRRPNVILETRVQDTWEKVVMTGGRFDFDVVTDFVITDTTLWLATEAGICQYDLKFDWLDLRHMRPLWGDQYSNTTDIRLMKKDEDEQVFFRRGNNNNAIYRFNSDTQTALRVPSVDSPFISTPLIETPYWRWVSQEKYQGSVAIGQTLRLDLKSASGVWAPVPLTSQNPFLPFDEALDLILYQDAVWLATPMGIWQYPTDKPFTIEHAKLFWTNGRLEKARRLAIQPDGRLYGSVGEGRATQVFFLDNRDRWQMVNSRRTVEQFLFVEDQWFWYERNKQVEIRYQDDPNRLRPFYNRQFADHYLMAVTSDPKFLWGLTPAGIFKYSGSAASDSLRLQHWVTAKNFQETPEHLKHLLPDFGSVDHGVYSIIRDEDKLWLLTKQALLCYNISTTSQDLHFKSSTDLTENQGPIIDGHLFYNLNQSLNVSLLTFGNSISRQSTFSIEPQTGEKTLLPPSQLSVTNKEAGYKLPEEDTVITASEDEGYIWIATRDAVYRVEKTALAR